MGLRQPSTRGVCLSKFLYICKTRLYALGVSLKQVIDPVRVYEINGQVCPVLSKYTGFAPGANQTVIAAVTGKRIRVMGLHATPSGAGNPSIILLNGSGGTQLFAAVMQANTVGPLYLPIVDSGYFETSTTTGLFATTATANIDVNVFYVEYTP